MVKMYFVVSLKCSACVCVCLIEVFFFFSSSCSKILGFYFSDKSHDCIWLLKQS